MLNQNSYNKHLTVDAELEWYEIKINQIRQYIEGINLADLTDRMDYKETKNGGMVRTVIASKEAQSKNFMDLMEKLPKLFNQLDELRNKYAEKQMLTRGNVETKNTGLDFADRS
jgi:hypothetical protein